MDRQYGEAQYTSILASDLKRGGMGVELTRICRGKQAVVAEVFFWDAGGTFTIETFNSDVPVDIIEELIAEAKLRIPTK
ncbi:MAG: hypothetical protein U0984_15260 [Prosthecobacter sp.]|nr:hypothetical protein [Prosthecobacter sp.]